MIVEKNQTGIKETCYHCGDNCNEVVRLDEKPFCCEGCKQVYLLLNENNLCNYYDLDKTPGLKAKGKFVSERFAYLDDAGTQQKLLQFCSDTQANVTFSLPQMHCSSCIFLLENLHRINPGIIRSESNFQRKEVFIRFDPGVISLRKVVELLAFIGYEPLITLNDTAKEKKASPVRKQIYRIGVAGFCFANIMMLSLPEYFSSGNIEQQGLKQTFSWIILLLSLPVLFYSGAPFFVSAFKAARQRFLNIDAPVALAIVVTFARSYYEIISGKGAGFLDSGTGIVFFMLIGRWFQDKTHDSLAFDRDYKSYFPLGITLLENGVEKNIPATRIQTGDRIIIRNEEMIPADSILISGDANIDYSFVSGESTPLKISKGSLLYAGGKQCGNALQLEVVKEVSQSYITRLWNNDVFAAKKNTKQSFIHPWSRYFTLGLFMVAACTALYWGMHDNNRLLTAVTSVLIVACPCSLLLSATFTFGNMVRVFGKNKFYLKNSSVIESLSKINTIVFDKTGTITNGKDSLVRYEGVQLSETDKAIIKKLSVQSSHPLSKVIASYLDISEGELLRIDQFKEYTGKGIGALINKVPVKMGTAGFVSGNETSETVPAVASQVHVSMNDKVLGRFSISNKYRSGLAEMVEELRQKGYELHVLSGDNESEKNALREIFGENASLVFNRSAQQKLDYVKQLQSANKTVLMIGDGLNDAGALMQSDVGIAVNDDTSRFTPACDAILDGSKLGQLARLMAYARSGKRVITASFILSILYNIVGLSFAASSLLSPMVAAILMPASSISIVLLVTLLSSTSARQKGLF